jgi:riboflavin synthase
MFSGIVEQTGRILALSKESAPYRLVISTIIDLSDIREGDSVCVEGVCLTVVGKTTQELYFDVVPETLRRTTLGRLRVGAYVNLERSLKLGERLHGHFVFGHVDATARLISKVNEGKDSVRMKFSMDPALRKFLVSKGSVALSGVSLTLGPVTDSEFTVYLIPHTLEVTTLSSVPIGGKVNVEVDMLARYALAGVPGAIHP